MGLDVEMFEGPIDSEFICQICCCVLLNPEKAACEHIFCQECVVRKLKSKTSLPECPTCGAKLSRETSEPSIDFKLQLLHLRIKCSHKCGEIVILGDLPDHVDTCPHTPVDCNFKAKGCNRKVKRCDLRKHLEECDFRIVECEACGYETVYRELYTHQSRVRCLEKKLKQQIVRERKVASQEINRHRERLFKDNVRLDQQQRKRLLTHSKSLCFHKNSRKSESVTQQRSRTDSDAEFQFSPRENVSVTENGISASDELQKNSDLLQHNDEEIRTARYVSLPN